MRSWIDKVPFPGHCFITPFPAGHSHRAGAQWPQSYISLCWKWTGPVPIPIPTHFHAHQCPPALICLEHVRKLYIGAQADRTNGQVAVFCRVHLYLYLYYRYRFCLCLCLSEISVQIVGATIGLRQQQVADCCCCCCYAVD